MHWKAVVLNSGLSVCNFGKFINLGLGTVRSERVKFVMECTCTDIFIVTIYLIRRFVV